MILCHSPLETGGLSGLKSPFTPPVEPVHPLVAMETP
jgi:hypothetical protein